MKENKLNMQKTRGFSELQQLRATKVYDTYWRFAAERQAIFFKRFEGRSPPWTDDPILAKHKFTNAYRASDRVSQYLIRNVIYTGEQSINETFFRIILFKLFNKIETWELLSQKLGLLSYSSYNFEEYDLILTKAIKAGIRIYSAAYIMSSGKSTFGFNKKHRNHLKLIELLMKDKIPERIHKMKSMKEVFELLKSYPCIGDFLAYQYSIDLNYSNITDFSESEFVVPGPGAKDGIKKCFTNVGGLNDADIIRFVTDNQLKEFEKRGLHFRTLWGRPLQLIDCQNLFCEVGKYARVAHPEVKGKSSRAYIKQLFRPNNNKSIEYWYPPKWEINQDSIMT